MSRIIVDNKKYYTKTIKRYFNALFSVVATLPDDCNYGCVNIKNRALYLALGLEEESYRRFLLEYDFITLVKDESYKCPVRTIGTQYFKINLYNICNFLSSLAESVDTFVNLPSIKHFAWRPFLPNEMRTFFLHYNDKSPECFRQFDKGRRYSIKPARKSKDDLIFENQLDDIDVCEIG